MATKKKKTTKVSSSMKDDSEIEDLENEDKLLDHFDSLLKDETVENTATSEVQTNISEIGDESQMGSDELSDDSIKKKTTLTTLEDESVNGLSTINYDIRDLPGVGATIAKKLEECGFTTVNALALTPEKVLIEQAGLGDKTAAKIIQAAREALNIGFKTADVVWERRKALARITTGSKELDDLLGGGGIETGALVEFFGEYRTGKTQVMHQLCVNVQLPRNLGGLEGCALYLDTEGTFRPERLIQMAEAKNLDYRTVLKNVIYARAYSSDHQVMLIKDCQKLVIEKNVKLIIVDSLISHFRAEYIGRGTLANRQQLLNLHIHDLLRLAEMFPELAIVVSNQVQSKPDTFFGDPTRATGGNVIAHGATIRIYLRKGKGEQRIAKMVDAPNLPEGEAIFVVGEGGISDI